MRKYVPLGTNQWKKVEKEYNASLTEQSFSERHRTFDSLKTMWTRLTEMKKPTGNPTLTRIEKEARQLTKMMDEKAGSKSIGIPAHLVGTAAESDGGAGPSDTLESIRSRPGRGSCCSSRVIESFWRFNPKRGVPTPRGNKRNAEKNFLGGAITEMLDIMKGKRDQAAIAAAAANEGRIATLENAFKASIEASNASFMPYSSRWLLLLKY
ncbi:hypothetical protein BD770DRAFT_432848 [Pilaira anomala]|nr:hypothetical protein BD770DRAFT_432848 [Pilaira anomala]